MTPPAAVVLGRIVDGEVRWQPARSPVDCRTATWPDPALTGWAQRRARDHVPGLLAAVRDPDGGLWQITLQSPADGSRLSAVPWTPEVPDASLTATLLEATGFQVSHALRSPLARLAGHHTLARRALDDERPDLAKREIEAAARTLEDQLDTTDQLAGTFTALVALARHAPPAAQEAPKLVEAVRDALSGLASTVPQPRLNLEVPGSRSDTAAIATIEVAEPGAVCADAVAVVAAYLQAAWIVEAVLFAHGHRLWWLCGPAAGESRVRTIAAGDLNEQVFAVGRSIAQGSAAGAVGFAAAFARLLRAGGEVTLTRTTAEHRRLAALLALGETGVPVLLDTEGEIATP